MNQENLPDSSVKALINASLGAIFLALIILFAAVLPAEYGIDPTGLGGKMGLLALSKGDFQSKNSGCSNSQQSGAVNSAANDETGANNELQPLPNADKIEWKDSVEIVIPPKKGLEYKFAMVKNAMLEFSWLTDDGQIYFDFHGEPKGATNGYFKSYLETTGAESSGRLTASFEGVHGWYWENDTDKPVSIRLSTRGAYDALGIMK